MENPLHKLKTSFSNRNWVEFFQKKNMGYYFGSPWMFLIPLFITSSNFFSSIPISFNAWKLYLYSHFYHPLVSTLSFTIFVTLEQPYHHSLHPLASSTSFPSSFNDDTPPLCPNHAPSHPTIFTCMFWILVSSKYMQVSQDILDEQGN